MKPSGSHGKRGKRKVLAMALLVLVCILSLWNKIRYLRLPLQFTWTTRYPPPKILERGELFHLIKTRFMQHQAHLNHLARARLELFKVFCLPSMVEQTNREFFWLISVDPDLPKDILSELVRLVQPYPHFYVTLTTDNLRPASGLHGIGKEIITGEVNVLRTNLGRWKRLAILETQLDADDALHIRYVEDLQRRAKDAFFRKNKGPDWMYWCVHQDLEWHWIHLTGSPGILKPSRSFVGKQKCYTPGMTLGMRRGQIKGVLDVPHSQLIQELTESKTKCGKRTQGLDCVNFVDTLEFPALRSRTPTSASMVGVQVQKKIKSSVNNSSQMLFQKASADFGFQEARVLAVNQHLSDNMALIVKDALEGQCSHGHSCRHGAKDALELLAKLYNLGN